MDYFAHQTAVIDDGAVIGKGTKIWHFSHVMPEARIGERCSFGQNCYVGPRVVIGDGVKVQNNVSLYEGAILEDEVFCGPSTVFTNVRTPRSGTPRNSAEHFAPTRLRHGASIGANATIVCGVTVGRYAFVAAGAVVTRDVPDHALVAGVPARRIGWACVCGLTLRFVEGAAHCACGRGFQERDGSVRALEEAAPGTPPAPVPALDIRAEIAPLLPALREACERVIASGGYVLGPEVQAFEEEAAAYLGCAHAVGLNSGTDALIIGLRVLGIGPGDEVITSPFSYVATSEAIDLVGATPVFVDIEEDGFNLDPALVEAAITERTRALVPVHLFGCPAAMDPLLAIAERHGLKVLEDTAQAFGGSFGTRKLGTLGEVGAYSFYPTKNLGGFGDGGLLATDDPALAAHARRLRQHGADVRYHNTELGYNSRLDALQAALLRVKLPHVEAWNARRRASAAAFREGLAGVAGLTLPRDLPGHVYNQFTVRIAGGLRDPVRARLQERGIGTMVYYPVPLHRLPLYAHLDVALPRAEAAADEVLSLPLGSQLSAADAARVCAALRDALLTSA